MTAAPTTVRRHRRTGAYWLVTAVVVGESAVGGTMDLFRMPPFYPIMIDLGYPSYLATILGTAKILAAVVLLAPRLPRLKEWAYAGILINMIGAARLTRRHAPIHHQPHRSRRVRGVGDPFLGVASTHTPALAR